MTGEVARFVKNFAESTLVIVTQNLANTIFLNLVKDFTIEQINQGIYEDIDLWAGFVDKEKYLEMGFPYRSIIVENIDKLTAEGILKYMAEKGDHWESQVGIILNTPGGVDWFSRQVNNIKEEIKRYYHESINERDNESGSS